MSKEFLKTFSENYEEISFLPREEVHKNGLLHEVVHIWIISSKNLKNNPEIYFQQRSRLKKTYPLCFDITCTGHISKDETPQTAAVREIYEETGLSVSKDDLFYSGSIRYRLTTDKIIDNELAHIFICEKIIENFTENEEVEKLIKLPLSDYISHCTKNTALTFAKTIPNEEQIPLSKNDLSRHKTEFLTFVNPYIAQ